MVNQPGSVNPNSPNPNKPAAQSPANNANNWNPPPLNWMGMQFNQDETKKLWMTIMQSVQTEIQRESDRIKKAMKKLRKSETGES